MAEDQHTPAAIAEPAGAGTEPSRPRAKAIVLMSGGLDSTLAAKLLQEQGVEVLGVNFSTGFCVSDHKRATAKADEDPKKLRHEGLRAGADLGVPVEIVDLRDDYLEVVFNPKHGYGAHMNPCIDCRAHMLKKAKVIMEREGADFIATGEVLGQRPMSQRKDTMRIVEKDSGLEGRLLRPLSAKRLKPTLAEQAGLVDREQLLGLQGRGRRKQMDLIESRGITDYPLPAGGCCFLTDESYAKKFRDKMTHRGKERIGWDDVSLLKLGRHFRLAPGLKLVVGRNEHENDFLERFSDGRVRLEARDAQGPLALTDESLPSPEQERLCAAIVARYSDAKSDATVVVVATGGGTEPRTYDVAPLLDEEILGPLRL
jgi:tRNA-uridine 2-sulfurtransferase